MFIVGTMEDILNQLLIIETFQYKIVDDDIWDFYKVE